MEKYEICYKPSAEKDFDDIPKAIAQRIVKKIRNLASNPFPSQVAQLSGEEKLYRIRVGDYRIVYAVDSKAKLIFIHYIRHRSVVYRRLSR